MATTKKKTTKKYKIVFTKTAIQNINEITGYIAIIKKEPLNAIKVGNYIYETISQISLNPLIFKECQELKTPLKSFRQAKCYSWQIIYKINESVITILGIIHSSRQPHLKQVFKK